MSENKISTVNETESPFIHSDDYKADVVISDSDAFLEYCKLRHIVKEDAERWDTFDNKNLPFKDVVIDREKFRKEPVNLMPYAKKIVVVAFEKSIESLTTDELLNMPCGLKVLFISGLMHNKFFNCSSPDKLIFP